MSSIDLKNISHFVRNIPPSSSTKNDCARGSFHARVRTILSSEVVGPICVLLTISVFNVLSIGLLSNTGFCSTLAFLTEIIVSCVFSIIPDAIYDSSAEVVERF